MSIKFSIYLNKKLVYNEDKLIYIKALYMYIYPIYFAESTLKPLRLSQTLKFLFNAITSKMKSSVACLAFDLQHIYHIYL